MNATAVIALSLIPKNLDSQPVFLCIDDTMAPKYGRKFEDVSKLFDHAAHNGSNYLNGHCFVSVMLCVPYVTSTGKEEGSRRLFFSTIFPYQLDIFCAWQEKEPLSRAGGCWMQYIPLFLYSFRWNIEVSYYEQKTFWSLCAYMVRSRKGIEMIANLINISYCAMKLLPYKEETFSGYRDASVQEFLFALSEQIRQQVFYVNLVQNIETHIKSNTVADALKHLCLRQGTYI